MGIVSGKCRAVDSKVVNNCTKELTLTKINNMIVATYINRGLNYIIFNTNNLYTLIWFST